MQREVIDFKEGRGERALSGYMHSSIVLEPEGHYCGHWVSVKTPPPPECIETLAGWSVPSLPSSVISSPLPLTQVNRLFFSINGRAGHCHWSGTNDNTNDNLFFPLQGASLDLRRHFNPLWAPLQPRTLTIKCVLIMLLNVHWQNEEKTMKAYWIWWFLTTVHIHRQNRMRSLHLYLELCYGFTITNDQERIKGTEKASPIHTLFHK